MDTPQREKAINAPWPALTVASLLIALFAAESQTGGADVWGALFGLIPSDLKEGRVTGVLTHMGVHASWLHVGMNAIGALAFGAPLARKLGMGLGGGLAFLGFVLLTGALAGVGHALLHMNEQVSLIGASGAVFGLIGAATRLMNVEGRLQPLFTRRTLTVAGTWIGANLLIALIGYDPASGVRSVAWDAHVLGLVAGLVLVGPWLRLFGRRDATAPADPPMDMLDRATPESQPDGPSGPWGPRRGA